jgi:hypothetical protein
VGFDEQDSIPKRRKKVNVFSGGNGGRELLNVNAGKGLIDEGRTDTV